MMIGNSRLELDTLRALHKKQNHTHGSEWMFQILSTKRATEPIHESHQRKLVDCSDPFYRDAKRSYFAPLFFYERKK